MKPQLFTSTTSIEEGKEAIRKDWQASLDARQETIERHDRYADYWTGPSTYCGMTTEQINAAFDRLEAKRKANP